MLDVSEIQTIDHDVVVIGAGGAGLRAAIECSAHGLSTGVLSKSLLGKAHFVVVRCKAVILATGGGGKAWPVTSNSWEYTGDGIAMAYDAGAELMDLEFTQFHPTGMVWPLSVRGILVTEGVRGDGGILKNLDGERFMFNYIPQMFAAETADTEEEADRW